MYYYRKSAPDGVAVREPFRGKRRKASRPRRVKRRGHFGILKFALCCLLLGALLLGGLYIAPMSLWSHDPEALSVYELPSGYTNILCLGTDINASG